MALGQRDREGLTSDLLVRYLCGQMSFRAGEQVASADGKAVVVPFGSWGQAVQLREAWAVDDVPFDS